MRTIFLQLREDKEYSSESIFNQISEKKIILEEIFEHLIKFIQEVLRPSIKSLRLSVYRNIDIESTDPYYNPVTQSINFGEWIGMYKIKLDEDIQLIVKVYPKIDVKSFEYMLNDSLNLINMIGLPMIKPLYVNVRGINLTSQIITYSYILRKYTELALSSGIPRMIKKVESIGRSVSGTMDYGKTISYMASGKPIAVAYKMVIGPAYLPLVILCKFHIKLVLLLKDVIEKLEEHKDIYGFNELIYKPILNMYNYHLYTLTRPMLKPYLHYAKYFSEDYPELFEEAEKQAGNNVWFRKLINLYREFLFKMPYIHAFNNTVEKNIPIQPLPSSKVYELWILKLFLENLINSRNIRIEEKEGGFKIKVDRKKFLYNIASEKLSIFFKNIVSPPRPDYIMVCGNNVAIGDAKYKYKISISDVERVIAYIIDYSRPQIDNGQEIKGFIIMLKHEHITPLLAQRLDMTPQLKIYVAEADPRNPLEAKIKIRNICNKVFK